MFFSCDRLLRSALQSEFLQDASPLDRTLALEMEELRRVFLQRPGCPQFCTRATSMSDYGESCHRGSRESASLRVGVGDLPGRQPAPDITVSPREGAQEERTACPQYPPFVSRFVSQPRASLYLICQRARGLGWARERRLEILEASGKRPLRPKIGNYDLTPEKCKKTRPSWPQVAL